MTTGGETLQKETLHLKGGDTAGETLPNTVKL